MIGDFNARDSDWNTQRNNNNGFKLRNFIDQQNYLLFYPEERTRYSPDGLTKTNTDLTRTKNIPVS